MLSRTTFAILVVVAAGATPSARGLFELVESTREPGPVERLVKSGRWTCENDELRWSSAPRQDNDTLRRRLRGRWLFMVGDSTLRMWHDYIAARLADVWGRRWPIERHRNYGPPRAEGICWGEDDAGCDYDVWVGGARLTFVWEPAASERALSAVARRLDATTGTPDVVLTTLGAHDHGPFNATHATFLQRLARTLAPRNDTWPPWPSTPPRIVYCTLTHCDEHGYGAGRAKGGIRPDIEVRDKQAQALARGLGWDVMDRTALTARPPYLSGTCETRYTASCQLGPIHPIGDVLAGMIDVLAASLGVD